jgi:SAM-dependent methyltransferase
MQDVVKSPFDPNWRDDEFTLEALGFDLALPQATPNDGKLWVVKRHEAFEFAFGQPPKQYGQPRDVTSLVTRSPLVKHYVMVERSGVETSTGDAVLDLVFPPKAWMSDNLQERCMMLAAAKETSGRVLVGGLGLGVYPQMLFALGRPVTSITIVDESEDVIALVHPQWMRNLTEQQRSQVSVVRQRIQSYAREVSQAERFDTIFLDIWNDADPRWLPSANAVIAQCVPLCAPGGRILCWGYALMVDAFVRDALLYVEKEFPMAEFNLDPGLERFGLWSSEHPTATTEERAAVARDIAITTTTEDDMYDREQFLGSYAPSRALAYVQMARARKRPV